MKPFEQNENAEELIGGETLMSSNGFSKPEDESFWQKWNKSQANKKKTIYVVSALLTTTILFSIYQTYKTLKNGN